MFKLKRPCANCPFRKGQGHHYRLSPARLEQIFTAPAFQCHKTITFDDEMQVDEELWDASWRPVKDDEHAQQCAGLMAVLLREGRPNTIMQVAERLDELKPGTIDPDGDAYGSIDEVLLAHGSSGRQE